MPYFIQHDERCERDGVRVIYDDPEAAGIMLDMCRPTPNYPRDMQLKCRVRVAYRRGRY